MSGGPTRRAVAGPWRRGAADAGLWVLVSVPVLLRSDPNDGGSWARVAAGLAVLALCTALYRRRPLVPPVLVLGASLAVSTELYTASFTPALIAFGYLAGRRQDGSRTALWLLGAAATAGLALTLATGASLGQWFTQLLVLALAVVAPWLIGRYVRTYDRLVRNGWELAHRMEREQAAVADRERLRERSRIAGDMHDSLGHDLSLIALRAAALEVDPTLGAAQQRAAGELRRAAADATARLRDVIGVLRADEPGAEAPTTPPDEPVEDLVARAAASGVPVTLAVERQGLPGLPPMSARAVHRVVQESLTNATKHAPGAGVEVTVGPGPDDGGTVEVVVVTGPRTAGPLGVPSGGSGLVGLDERVRLAGGRLEHEALPGGGFRVRALVPVTAAPPAPVAAAPTSAQELDRARREVRRGLARVVWVPLALLTGLAVLMAGVGLYTQYQSYLPRDRYEAVHVGQTRDRVETLLPETPLDGPPHGAPPEPTASDSCRYYRTTLLAAVPVYRLCFTADRLTDLAVIT
ncbi:histidine kinase [Streptomyces sp. HUAS MG47]|uniref:sensor histidine kinase n=1 Tax=Streptomyces solicamelliae TaxID=3231716 RepID=UPI00387844B7